MQKIASRRRARLCFQGNKASSHRGSACHIIVWICRICSRWHGDARGSRRFNSFSGLGGGWWVGRGGGLNEWSCPGATCLLFIYFAFLKFFFFSSFPPRGLKDGWGISWLSLSKRMALCAEWREAERGGWWEMKRLTRGQGWESAINWRELARSHSATARGDIIISQQKNLRINIFQVDFCVAFNDHVARRIFEIPCKSLLVDNWY